MLEYKLAVQTAESEKAHQFEFTFRDGDGYHHRTRMWMPKSVCIWEDPRLRVRSFWVEKMEEELASNGWKSPVGIEVI
ncbi:MAG: hypothetical protein V3U60_16065 [Gammaproteobacteria bacterium]